MILVIGSTGNIGKHVVAFLNKSNAVLKEGLYKPKVETKLNVAFDFLDKKTYENALKDVKKVFFIRPPKLKNPKDIYPFLDYCKALDIEHIVFASLMGVEKIFRPPHAKIERYIKRLGLPYTFIRPSFFMENLIYPYGKDIKEKNQIIIPAKRSKVAFISAKDIGEVCATVLLNSEEHINQAYTITGPEALNYHQVASRFSRLLKRYITYTKPSMSFFRRHMLDKGFDNDYVKISKHLYFMNRSGKSRKTNNVIEQILNRPATVLDEFIIENLSVWKK